MDIEVMESLMRRDAAVDFEPLGSALMQDEQLMLSFAALMTELVRRGVQGNGRQQPAGCALWRLTNGASCVPLKAKRLAPWPNGKPTYSELLPDGCTRHLLADGREFTVPSKPSYLLDYLANGFVSKSDDTYHANVAFAGLSAVEGFYEVWNFDISEVRQYSFERTVRLTHVETGEVFSPAELEAGLRASMNDGDSDEVGLV